jgi:hypothetical protein
MLPIRRRAATLGRAARRALRMAIDGDAFVKGNEGRNLGREACVQELT